MAWRLGGRQDCKACRRSPMWSDSVIRRCRLDVWFARKRNDRAIYRKPGETGRSLSHAPLWGSYQSSARSFFETIKHQDAACPPGKLQRDKAELISDIILQAGARQPTRDFASPRERRGNGADVTPPHADAPGSP